MIMTTGPIEYLVLGFPDGALNDEVANELVKLVDGDSVRILDFVYLVSDSLGEISVAEIDELGQLSAFDEVDIEIGGLIGPEDIEFVSGQLVPGCSAAVLLLEDVWAASLASALDRTGGVLIEGARIPKVFAESAMAALSAA
jgi:Family of unknown function (DUF6325)